MKKVEQFLGILVFQRSCKRYFANLGSQRELKERGFSFTRHFHVVVVQ